MAASGCAPKIYAEAILLRNTLPRTEVLKVLDHSGDCIAPNDKTPQERYKWYIEQGKQAQIDQIATMLVNNRMNNKVCNICRKAPVIECRKCKMTYWCSQECVIRDKNNHDTWCLQPWAPVDKGPMGTALINAKTGGIINTGT